jgi:hypothetical protein
LHVTQDEATRGNAHGSLLEGSWLGASRESFSPLHVSVACHLLYFLASLQVAKVSVLVLGSPRQNYLYLSAELTRPCSVQTWPGPP